MKDDENNKNHRIMQARYVERFKPKKSHLPQYDNNVTKIAVPIFWAVALLWSAFSMAEGSKW